MTTGGSDSAIEQLLALGQSEAERFGFSFVVERSDRSEARYLYVRRHQTWFGYRIAGHEPFYNCSADYQQILLPEYATGDVLRRSLQYLKAAIRSGGNVVADPAEVCEFIDHAARQQVHNTTVTNSDGSQWCWNADDGNWVGLSEHADGAEPPTFTPRGRLSARAQCSIRHRLNFMARWTYDESTRSHVQSPTVGIDETQFEAFSEEESR